MALSTNGVTHDEDEVDVLILGSGSAGLMCATWLATYNHYHNAEIRYRILEKRDGPLKLGQADGVQCRTVEIFQALGLDHLLLNEAYWVNETVFWTAQGERDAADTKKEPRPIVRTGRTADTEPGLSHLPHVILNQARMNGYLLEKIRQLDNLEVDYSQEVQDVKITNVSPEDKSAYPVSVKTRNLSTGATREIRAKYALGSDGAHSAVRHALNIKMVGDSKNAVYGVMDVYVQTDFPDIRKKATIRADAGVLMIIPREGGSLVRFYVELAAGTVAKEVKLEDVQAVARAIFSPYTMEFAETIWWSAYSIGQRLAERMHDGSHRVFLAGDACHTHSPKAGQGMNCSLQDGDNLGFKLGSILAELAKPSILETYVTERQQYAAQLIEFDKWWSSLYSTHGKGSQEDFRTAYIQAGVFAAGMGAEYQDSMVVDRSISDLKVSKKVKVGMRLPSVQLVRKSDSKPAHLQSLCHVDGRWRVLLFGGSGEKKGSNLELVNKIAQFLDSKDGPVRRITPATRDIDSVIETLVVLHGDRNALELEELDLYFTPIVGKRKLKDLDKIFFDDESFNHGHGKAYETLGIDPELGCIVVVRPDQYVAAVLPVQEYPRLSQLFARAMIEAS